MGSVRVHELNCANDRRAARIEKLKNILPEVFLLEFITDKLCVFELLLFGHFSILHNFAERPFVPFFYYFHFAGDVLRRISLPAKLLANIGR